MGLKNLFGKKKEAPVESAPSKLSSSIEESILGVVGARSIPPMPGAAQKAFQLSTDPNAEARDFVAVIESDESLSARVVKIANSVYFDRGNHPETIEESVLVIGINELRCLLNAATMSEIFPSSHPARAQLWINDIATALISRQLAQRFLPGKEDLAFLAGLMHDLGKLLLLQRVAPDYTKVLTKIQECGCDFCTAEEALFPFTHTEVGQLIADRWHFAPDVIAVIRGHHQKLPAQKMEAPPLPFLVECADRIAHVLAFGHPRGFAKFQRACEEKLDEVWIFLGIEPAESREMIAQLKKSVELELDLYAGKKA